MLPFVIATCRKWFCRLELNWSRDYLKRFYGELRSLRHYVCPGEISSLDVFERPYLCFTLSWYVFSFLNQWTQLFHIAPKALVDINSWFFSIRKKKSTARAFQNMFTGFCDRSFQSPFSQHTLWMASVPLSPKLVLFTFLIITFCDNSKK